MENFLNYFATLQGSISTGGRRLPLTKPCVRCVITKNLGAFLTLIYCYNGGMRTIALTFHKKTQTGVDLLGDPTYDEQDITVDGCLIGPISEPASVREQQALEAGKDQVRIHLPKTFDGDISNSTVNWCGETFKVDQDGVQFMNENTPTQWNRYFRAESING